MADKCDCACSQAPKLIFACSGGSDVGAISDLAGRKLGAQGMGKMFCLAGIGGQISGIVKTAEAAQKILVIDGCPLKCAKATMEQAGFTNFDHIELGQDMDMKKGDTPPSEENVDAVVAKARGILE